jgi:hypothetical protein
MLKKNKYLYFIIGSILLLTPILRFCIQSCSDGEFSSYSEYRIRIKEQASSSLAFLLLDSQLSDFHNQKDRLISQEIVVNGIDNIMLQHRLLLLLGIDLDQQKVIPLKQIDSWISKLKLSGFFTEVQSSHCIVHNHQIIRINVSTNPILKTVGVINQHEKLIPYSYLLFIFRDQAGYPINFNNIANSLNLLAEWYHLRGYKWADIKLISAPYLAQDILIDIQEGVISKIEFVGYNQQGHFIQTYKEIPIQLLLAVIKIKPLQILNIDYLEQGIVRLKAHESAFQCNYEIYEDNEGLGDLYIVLKLEILNERSTYIFNKNISISSYLMESIEQLFKYSLDGIFDNVLSSQYSPTSYLYLAIRNRSQLVYSNNILYLNLCYGESYFEDLISPRNIYNYQDLKEWNFSQLLFFVADHLGFRHYRRNIGIHNSNCLLDGYFSSFPLSPSFNLKYEMPWLSLRKLYVHYLNCSLFRSFYNSGDASKSILLDPLGSSYFCYKESLGSQVGWLLECINSINSKFWCHKKLKYTRITSQYVRAHDYIQWYQTNLKVSNSSDNNLYSAFRQIWTHRLEKLLLYHIQIKYTNYIRNTNSFNLSFQSIHLMPQGNSQLSYDYKNKINYSHKTIVKAGHVIKLQAHKVQYTLQLIYLLGTRNNLPLSQESFRIGPDIVRGYARKVFPFPLKFGKINLEYHVPFSKNNTIFCFIDYGKNITNYNELRENHVLMARFLHVRYSNFYQRMSYGLGLHIIIPIRQIPPLRVEFGYNINNGQCIHLRVYK